MLSHALRQSSVDMLSGLSKIHMTLKARPEVEGAYNRTYGRAHFFIQGLPRFSRCSEAEINVVLVNLNPGQLYGWLERYTADVIEHALHYTHAITGDHVQAERQLREAKKAAAENPKFRYVSLMRNGVQEGGFESISQPRTWLMCWDKGVEPKL